MRKLKITIITLILIIASLIGYIIFQSNTYYGTVLATEDMQTTQKENEEEFELGDVDGDGSINAIDASYCLQIKLLEATNWTTEKKKEEIKSFAYSEEARDRADVNKDGRVDSMDAYEILQYSAYLGAGATLEEEVKDENGNVIEGVLTIDQYVKYVMTPNSNN